METLSPPEGEAMDFDANRPRSIVRKRSFAGERAERLRARVANSPPPPPGEALPEAVVDAAVLAGTLNIRLPLLFGVGAVARREEEVADAGLAIRGGDTTAAAALVAIADEQAAAA